MRFFQKIVVIIGLCSSAAVFSDEPKIVGHSNSYTLGSGDLLKITIFNQDDISGEYPVNGNGDISLPLIGTIRVKNLTKKYVKLIEKIKKDE